MNFLTPMVEKASKAVSKNKFKKLSLAVGLSCTLLSQQALALTLSSEPEQASVHIFQPLDLKIEIIDKDDEVSINDMIVNMASQRSFESLGLERNFFLSKLDIKLKTTPEGVKYVHITSRELVKEPFLMLLLEVTWPTGHLYKDYTLLFDAPLTQQRNISNVVNVSSNSVEVMPKPIVVTQEKPREITSKPTSSGSQTYTVKDTDTLWEIALKTKPQENISVQQMMLSLQDKNPNAFVNNNINILKSGVTLDIPTAEEALIRTKAEANQEVYDQSKPKSVSTIEEKVEPVEEAIVQPEIVETTQEDEPVKTEDSTEIEETRPQLRLVTSDDGLLDDNSASGNQDAVIDSLENDLAIALDQIEKEQRVNAEKISTISELEEQNDTLNRILDLKSQELAVLQQQLVEQSQETDVEAELVEDEAASTQQETLVESAEGKDLAEVDDLIGFLEVEGSTNEVSEKPETQVTSEIENIETPVKKDPEPVNELEVPEKSITSENIFTKYVNISKNWIMSSPINMGIAGVTGLLVLILLLSLFTKNKRKEESSFEGDDLNDIESLSVNDEIDDDLLSDIDLENDSFGGLDEDLAIEEADALEEAQKSIGYGDLDQAITILEAGYQLNNSREDIAVKLLDLYGQTGQNDKFADLEARVSINATSSMQAQIKALSDQYYPNEQSLDSNSEMDIDSLDIDDLEINLDELPETQTDELEVDIDAELSMEIDESLLEETNIDSSDKEDDSLIIEEELEISLEDIPEDIEIQLEEQDDTELSLEINDNSLEVTENESSESGADFEFSLDELDSEIAELDAQFSADESGLETELEVEDNSIELDISEESVPSMTVADVESDAEIKEEIDSDIDFMGDNDENSTKLNLAKAFVEMGDSDSAKEMLEEIIEEGDEQQKNEAQKMIDSL